MPHERYSQASGYAFSEEKAVCQLKKAENENGGQ